MSMFYYFYLCCWLLDISMWHVGLCGFVDFLLIKLVDLCDRVTRHNNGYRSRSPTLRRMLCVWYLCSLFVKSLMAASNDRLPNIDKLDQMNWPLWKLQIKAYLEAWEFGNCVLVMKLSLRHQLLVLKMLPLLLMCNSWPDTRLELLESNLFYLTGHVGQKYYLSGTGMADMAKTWREWTDKTFLMQNFENLR